MPTRPRLKRHARALRRAPGTLQIGMAADCGVILDGLSEAEVGMLERLDGRLDLPGLYAEASGIGVSAERLSELLTVLRERRLLLEAPSDRATLSCLGSPWRHRLGDDADSLAAAYGLPGDGYGHLVARRRQFVLVSGAGGVPSAVAALLQASGVGRVDTGPTAADRLELDLGSGGEEPSPDLVVLTGGDAVSADAGEPWRRRGIPHLPLVTQEHRFVVGPLVQRGGPCLRCLDLHRADRDPGWPALLSQLAPGHRVAPAEQVDASTTLTAAAAALTAMVVHAWLDGRQAPADLSLEVSMPWPQVGYRRWPPHPRCRCGGPAPGPQPGGGH